MKSDKWAHPNDKRPLSFIKTFEEHGGAHYTAQLRYSNLATVTKFDTRLDCWTKNNGTFFLFFHGPKKGLKSDIK